jgi:hypothetical protein
MGGHVFICYDHEEGGPYVARLAAHLIGAGVPVWYDREIITGHRWAHLIRDQIDTAAAFITVMTPRGERSDWINREIDQAQQVQLPIFPLLLAGTRYFRVADIQYEDVTHGRMPSDDFVRRLRDLVTGGVPLRAAPTPAVPAYAPPAPVPAAPQTLNGPPIQGPSWFRRHRTAIRVSAVILVLATIAACVLPALFFVNVFRDFPFLGAGTGPTTVEANGPAPWTISGMGYTYEFEGITRTQSTVFGGEFAASLTISGHVTRTAEMSFTSMSYNVRTESGVVLGRTPDSVWEGDPTLNQRLPIKIVVYDSNPAAKTLTVTISDFFRSDQDLIMKDIPVPA